ncbi:hypothetical protein LOTGIDRAFT_229186 [Lottia gigantea]|uniref:Uncharacterized protein n=1 Tax=Lottia gigantea TaxID=225164 RepID=V3ZE22_LOTGI|nr:hypothetical protein LOTGIDRAFT_229186 [Lottia gigantea]ESO89333.1 hypothetical protein LOTGIDRAFT_229186 [Lottia gigantea]
MASNLKHRNVNCCSVTVIKHSTAHLNGWPHSPFVTFQLKAYYHQRNGKRSDPSLTDNTENSRQETLLRQILLPQTYEYHKSNDALLQDDDINTYEKSHEESQRMRDLRALNILLKTLMMEQKVRTENSVMA